MIPAKTSEDLIGLFDKVTNKYYLPAEQEAWQAGPVIPHVPVVPVIDTFTGLTFTANAPSTLSFSKGNMDIQYSLNNGTWTNYDTAGTIISLNTNDTIKWKRNSSTILTGSVGTF